MSTRERPTPGTTLAALSITSSIETAYWRPVETPLGERYGVYTLSVTGRKQEIALCRTRQRAAFMADALTRAAEALQEAGRHLARDREETE